MNYEELRKWVSTLKLEPYTRHIITEILYCFINDLHTAGALCFRTLLCHVLADNSDISLDEIEKYNYDKIIRVISIQGYDTEKLYDLKDKINKINHAFEKGNKELSLEIKDELQKFLNYFYQNSSRISV